MTIEPAPVPRPPSPWPGSLYETRHRWQLDTVGSLAEAAKTLRSLSAEMSAAHTAGWWLVEPMSNGYLHAARESRRQRGRLAAGAPPATARVGPPRRRWRLRVIDEAPVAGEECLDAAAATRTPVLAWTGGALRLVSGPDVAQAVVTQLVRQVAPHDLAGRRWGLAPARVGPNVDLVADGSALRLHTVAHAVLLRTCEAFTLQHAADGSETLLQAAVAYENLAHTADAMAAAGGRLVSADDGLVEVAYDRSLR